MTRVEFTVLGVPAPQGSKRHVGRGVLVESSKALPAWREAVAWEARRVALECPGAPFAGQLHLRVAFRFPMPKSRPAAARRRGWAHKTTAPDLDKLLRALGDSLQAGGLIADDAAIASITATKIETTSWTGAVVTIEARQ